MTFLPNVDHLAEILNRDLLAFLPELLLCCAIVLMLLFRLFSVCDRMHMGWFALLVTLVALAISVFQFFGLHGFHTPESYGDPSKALPAFSHLLVFDNLALFTRMFLLAFT